MIILLMPNDIAECDKVTQMRVKERTSRGAKDRSDEHFYRNHYSGVLGEYAVCKAYNCDWLGKYFEGRSWDSRTYDTAMGEVRSTTRPGLDGGMRLYESDDRLEAPYIWVTLQEFGSNKSMVKAEVVGWIYPKDGRKSKWWNKEKGYWVVPRDNLKPMDKFPKKWLSKK